MVGMGLGWGRSDTGLQDSRANEFGYVGVRYFYVFGLERFGLKEMGEVRWREEIGQEVRSWECQCGMGRGDVVGMASGELSWMVDLFSSENRNL